MINSLTRLEPPKQYYTSPIFNVISQNQDNIQISNKNFDKKTFLQRGIIKNDESVEKFFDRISSEVFKDNKNLKNEFYNSLLNKKITLSSSMYFDLNNPKSAQALELEDNCEINKANDIIEEHIKQGRGIGLNLTNQDDPISLIKSMNFYMKTRQPNLKRPPAGIAILDIHHPKILEFINLKKDCNYNDWCFDLSVILDESFLKSVDNDEDITLADGSRLSAKIIYSTLLENMNKKGEPGVIFSSDKNFISDSCCCTQLKPSEGLSLAHINLCEFYNPKTNDVDYKELRKNAKILSLALKKIDKNGYVGILGFQDLLNRLNLTYGEKKSFNVLNSSLKIIKEETKKENLKMAISPTGTTSKFLKTTTGIDSDCCSNYYDELDMMIEAQKYLDGGISKTIYLKENDDESDVNAIIRYCAKNNIKGISVFKK